MKVAVIHGGDSTEAAVSTLNASYVEKALVALGYEVSMVSYDETMIPTLMKEQPEAVFLCVQGKGHGDGTLQGILDFLKIPYTGSLREAATIINNKILCQTMFAKAQLPIAPNFTWSEKDHIEANGQAHFQEKMKKVNMKFPCVAKAPTQGGSFGIVLLHTIEDYSIIEEIFQYDQELLIEEFLEGDFYTVGILKYKGEHLILPVMQGMSLEDDHEFICFTGKYKGMRASLPSDLETKMQAYAKKAFETSGARTYARVDFILEKHTMEPYVLEINAVPGIKASSLFPPAVELMGISYNEMIEAILLDCIQE